MAFLAGGELVLLFRKPWVRWAVWLVLIFATAFTVAVVSGAQMSTDALAVQLPRGIKVLGDGTPAHRLAQQVSYPAYCDPAARHAVVGVEDARPAGAAGTDSSAPC